MDKPILFFSHSSKDSSALIKLKEMILQKTNNAVEIFLSSDGESIPFGRNWVHEIEEALNNSKISFVFLTPNSINSKWLYFEAGHSYSRARKVVPVGLFGLDLYTITPPLGLLQGFNIIDKNGLNNIISTINENFQLSCEESFRTEDYNDLLVLNEDFVSNTFSNLFSFVQVEFRKKIDMDNEVLEISSTFLSDFKNYLNNEKIEYLEQGSNIHFEGGHMYSYRYVPNEKDNHRLTVDSNSFAQSLSIIKKCIELAYATKSYYLSLEFQPTVFCYTDLFQLSSRLMQYDFHFTEKGILKFQDISFDITQEKKDPPCFSLTIYYDTGRLCFESIQLLVDKLFLAGVCETAE